MSASPFAYPMALQPDDNDTLLVTCRDLPDLATFGDNREAALAWAAKALVAVVSARMDRNVDMPVPSRAGPGEVMVSLPALVAAKLTIWRATRVQGLTQMALAERLGKDPRQVRRLLDPLYASRFDDVEAALAALGKTLVIEVTDRAAA